MITQFGIDMIVPIALCSLLGYYLDKKLGTSWIFVLMFFIGAVAGAGNVYRFAKKVFAGKSSDVRNRDLASEVALPDEEHSGQSGPGSRESDP